jgi:CMP-N-acetylneuraminic acid synthetase
MKILIVIPARGGSKGLPNKNIMPLLGKPLIGYTIEAAKESALCDKIVVSTDDVQIAACAREFGVPVIMRPAEYSRDDSPIEQALRHAVLYLKDTEGYEPEMVVWLQANVPIRKPGQIDTVINKVIESGSDSAFTVNEVARRPEFMKRMDSDSRIIPLYQTKEYQRQGFLDKLYVADGAVIVVTTKTLMATEGLTGAHVFLGDDIRGVPQDPQYAVEIDDQFDFDVATGLLLVEQTKK